MICHGFNGEAPLFYQGVDDFTEKADVDAEGRNFCPGRLRTLGGPDEHDR